MKLESLYERRTRHRDYFKSLWSYRFFVTALVREQSVGSYSETRLGKLWNLLDPLLTAAVYYVVFGVVLGLDRGVENFPLWLVLGVFTFRTSLASWNAGSTSLTSSGGLLEDQRFPPMIVPMIKVISSFYDLMFKFIIILILIIVSRQAIGFEILFLPLVILAHFLITAGITLILAKLVFHLRDIQQLFSSSFHVLRLASGVMIPVTRFDRLPPAAYRVIEFNPMHLLLEFYRYCFGINSSTVKLSEIIFMTAFLMLICSYSVIYFRRNELEYGNDR